MCGIFGYVLGPDAEIDRVRILDVVSRSFLLAETRGKEASGLAIVFPDSIEIVKHPLRARNFLKDPQTQATLHRAVDAFTSTQPLILLGHTRMVTNGSPENHDNNQPVSKEGLICLHNGIIVNDADLWRAHPGLHRAFEVDTEVLLALVAQGRRRGASLVSATVNALAEARGANSIALLGDSDDVLLLATTNGSLFTASGRNGTAIAFASERYILERICAMRGISKIFAGQQAVQLRPRHGMLIPLTEPVPQPFRLGPLDASPDFVSEETGPVEIVRPTRRRIVDNRKPAGITTHPCPSSIGLLELERVMNVDQTRIRSLRRCTACLLPDTFPFIAFDGDGVCQFCRAPRPMPHHGETELRRIADIHRRQDGEADCLVPISGGRDSCFSLHYIKKELGLNPVAYTYDWGMVTDLARRNISRMCEGLGVEHLLIAAHIRRKRKNIRLNVSAWLRQPHLGTVPLFMAGDKQFFYYSSKLRRQMRLPLVIYSMNRLERTDFKVGFCGINEVSAHSKTYGLSTRNKVWMALFYAKEFLKNPRLINVSIGDTLAGYLSYYVLPQDYISLFDYLDWKEEVIHKTISMYGWETASDSNSTWRVGDGTAAFYNYIYYKVAGFSEHDTFRSNQIRHGLIARERALESIADENRPRAASFKWYCDTIGIDATEAVRAINRMPELYP